MDERALAELEIAQVARLYGLVETRGTRHETQEVAPVSASTMDWTQLKEAVRTCQLCALCKQRKQAVFGVGAESALMKIKRRWPSGKKA